MGLGFVVIKQKYYFFFISRGRSFFLLKNIWKMFFEEKNKNNLKIIKN